MHYISRSQGDVLSGKQLSWFDAFPDPVAEDDDLGWVGGAEVIGCHQRFGEGHAFRPRDDVVPDLAIDRNAWSLPLSLHLLHSDHGFLLAGDIGLARLGAGLALGDAACERDGH
jgi:hypothetical protein